MNGRRDLLPCFAARPLAAGDAPALRRAVASLPPWHMLTINALRHAIEAADPWRDQRHTIGPWGSTMRTTMPFSTFPRATIDAAELLLWLEHANTQGSP